MKFTMGNKLNDDQITSLRTFVIDYLGSEEYVTNRILRAQTEINYDQAIYFFNRMISSFNFIFSCCTNLKSFIELIVLIVDLIGKDITFEIGLIISTLVDLIL